MNSFLWVAFSVLAILLFMVISYLKTRGRTVLSHSESMVQLQLEYAIHEQQIEQRHSDLSRYDFMKYNLTESLQPQYEIKL